jgi:hypothetical protein
MRILTVLVVLLIAACAATYARYGSLSPCDWMERDLAQQSDLPLVALQARIRAEFLLDGVTDPGPQECLFKWWKLRQDGLESG